MKAPTRAKQVRASINNRSESQVRCGKTFHVSGGTRTSLKGKGMPYEHGKCS